MTVDTKLESPPAIALLSDFGEQDSYVGVMKGVIAQINPHLRTIDLTHGIARQNIAAGRFCLLNAIAYFPVGNVYIAVVDPGVGSQRRGIAIACERGLLVGPDNGLFSGVLDTYPATAAVELNNPKYWRSPHPSNTFHGRDIFAPVGAHLASGVPFAAVGQPILVNSLVSLPGAPCQVSATEIKGCIQYIDSFGNGITNIVATDLPVQIEETGTWHLAFAEQLIPVGLTYSDVATGEAIALIGSHGWVEIAVNQGSAQQRFNFIEGEPVRVVLSPCPKS